jgi:hypothetical protein
MKIKVNFGRLSNCNAHTYLMSIKSTEMSVRILRAYPTYEARVFVEQSNVVHK